MIEVVRPEQQRLVLWVEQRQHHVDKGLVGPCCDHDIILSLPDTHSKDQLTACQAAAAIDDTAYMPGQTLACSLVHAVRDCVWGENLCQYHKPGLMQPCRRKMLHQGRIWPADRGQPVLGLQLVLQRCHKGRPPISGAVGMDAWILQRLLGSFHGSWWRRPVHHA